jgi:CCR4-NOT transcriptional regulation complex NOT5 subunit
LLTHRARSLASALQRHEEPKAGGQPGDDWEQGTYVYFDSTLQDEAGSGWCYRLKTAFQFQYSALEDEVPLMA